MHGSDPASADLPDRGTNYGRLMPGELLPGYEEFFMTEYGRVVAFLCKAGFTNQIADDATAYAMTSAYRCWRTIKNPRGWVRSAAHRTAVKYAVAYRTELPRLLEKGYLPPNANAADMFRHLDLKVDLLRILRSLPDQQRLVMAWHLDGFNAEEIAQATNLQPSTVRSHLRHARAKIRKSLTSSDVEKGHR